MSLPTKERHFGKTPLTRALGLLGLVVIIIAVLLLSSRIDALTKRLEQAYAFYPGIAYANESENLLVHKDEVTNAPRIALHPLSFSQYRQHHKNGSEMAELITSLLMVELGKSDHMDLLDRSMVSVLFSEKSNILINDKMSAAQSTLEKLPISDFTIVGSLFSSDKGKSFSLKLVSNKTGQILGASLFNYTLDTLGESIQESVAFIQGIVKNAQSIINTETINKIAIGHFIDISKSDSQINQGRDITERLIEKFVNDKDYSVLSRTQLFPLVFEEYLRFLQYTDEHQESLRYNAKYLVYGKYRVNRSNATHPLSIYLYIDLINHGRELFVIPAKNWSDAYDKISNEIINFIPDYGNQISIENRNKSKKLFLQALRIRGMLHYEKILTGIKPPSKNDITSFAVTYKSENLAPARKLIEQSLALNPHNPFSRLAKAMYLKTEGDTKVSNQIIREVLKNQDPASSEVAYQILVYERYKLKSRINVQDFVPLVGIGRAEEIYKSLIDEKYLRKFGDRVSFNSAKKSDQVFNHTHTLSLKNLDANTAIQVFEKLRAAYYRPGKQVRFLKPRRFHPRNAKYRRKWSQTTNQNNHNLEAVLHFDIASNASDIYINDATTLPSVEFYDESKLTSNERRQSNLEIAVDGFSTSVYLDTSYLKAKILLAYSLCQAEIKRCASGNMIHSWVVDHTKAVNLKGRGGIYFNVSADVEVKDRLIFLAADAIDRVTDANFSDMFQYSLTRDKYFVRKSEEKLNALLLDKKSTIQKNDNGKQKPLLSVKSTPVPKNKAEKIVTSYTKLIRDHCQRLMRDKREIRYSHKYVGPVEELGKFIQKNKHVTQLGKSLLADIEADYPGVYPYLIVNAKSLTPFVIAEQDAVVEKVVSGKIIPIKISDFMKISLNIFEARVRSGNLKIAKIYIEHYVKHYGINEMTAMDFAYLYHRIGDSKKSKRLLKEYGKKSFTISNFTLPHVDGTYVNNGFDKKGYLRFDNKSNRNIHILYRTAFVYTNGTKFLYSLGEIPVKWVLYSKKTRSHNGNVNPKHRDLFSFGNGGTYKGTRIWTSPTLAKNTKPADTKNTVSSQTVSDNYIEVDRLKEAALDLPENNLERLFDAGYKFDTSQKSAIKGFPNKPTIGPVLDSYFSASLSRTRKISAVKEKLFEKGYLTVSGLPIVESRRAMFQKIDSDFSDYSARERSSVERALLSAKKVKGAGYVKIINSNNNTWKPTSILIAEDAIANRHFGLTTAIYGNYALICDYKDGLYSFKKIDKQWKLQQRIESRCKNVVMNKNWAIVSAKEKSFVYKNIDGSWMKTQTLIVNDFLLKRDKRQRFSYYGDSLALTKDMIVIGNPYGGVGGVGEVYIFNLVKNKWQQSQVLLPNKNVQGFGKSISANNNFIIIGNPTTGDFNTPELNSGSVYVYTKVNSSWALRAHLVPKNRPKNAAFGSRVLLKNGRLASLLIKSRRNVFRYNLSPYKL